MLLFDFLIWCDFLSNQVCGDNEPVFWLDELRGGLFHHKVSQVEVQIRHIKLKSFMVLDGVVWVELECG